ncbi:MAG: TadE/TadG family type IV pilus assembly protein [Acidimicrobiales bacterium]
MELALVLPVIVVLVLAGIQVGLVARDRLLLAHVAREAARVAAVDPEPSAVTAAAANATSLDQDRLTVLLGPNRQPGDRLVVVVSYRASTSVPLVGLLVGDRTLETEVTTRVE